MASTATLISLEEYLHTTYRPDRDFLEGELLERNMGEQSHATVQGFLVRLFGNRGKEWDIRVLPEQRVQVSADRFRIPDVCILHRSDPFEEVVRKAPLLCIEVLSSGDTVRSIQERVNDYAAMGVEHTWVLDPWFRVGYYGSPRGLQQPEDGILRIAGTPIEASLAEVFAELDEA